MNVPTILFLCSLFLVFKDHLGYSEACLSVVRIEFNSFEFSEIGTSEKLPNNRFGLNVNPPFF